MLDEFIRKKEAREQKSYKTVKDEERRQRNEQNQVWCTRWLCDVSVCASAFLIDSIPNGYRVYHNLLMIMKCLSNLKFWCLINWRFIYVFYLHVLRAMFHFSLNRRQSNRFSIGLYLFIHFRWGCLITYEQSPEFVWNKEFHVQFDTIDTLMPSSNANWHEKKIKKEIISIF